MCIRLKPYVINSSYITIESDFNFLNIGKNNSYKFTKELISCSEKSTNLDNRTVITGPNKLIDDIKNNTNLKVN